MDSGFDEDPSRYLDYLEGPDGRLRVEVALAHLHEEVLDRRSEPGQALDLGGGAGHLALRLAECGWAVTVADRSPRMLERARLDAGRRHLGHLVACCRVDADEPWPPGLRDARFDLVTCHHVLEYLDTPGSALFQARRLLRPDGRLSVVVRNRAGEVLRAAIVGGDLASAQDLLTATHVRERLYGLELRLFDPGSLARLLRDAGFVPVAERGIRVVADYLPGVCRTGEDWFARACEVERRLDARPEFAAVARYLHVIAKPG